jgi:hypothetical protein
MASKRPHIADLSLVVSLLKPTALEPAQALSWTIALTSAREVATWLRSPFLIEMPRHTAFSAASLQCARPGSWHASQQTTQALEALPSNREESEKVAQTPVLTFVAYAEKSTMEAESRRFCSQIT